MSNNTGRIISVSGPLVTADNMRGASIQEICHVGSQKLIGEIIEINEDIASVQVYEETSGLSFGDPLQSLGEPLSVELGPGIMSAMFDGIQRPLYGYVEVTGSNYLQRGVNIPALDRHRLWAFTPTVEVGQTVAPGDVIGTVPETQSVLHKIMVPHGASGQVASIESGSFAVDSVVCTLVTPTGEEHQLTLMQKWPVRTPRPIAEKIGPERPVVTGQRIIDSFFPVLKGGTAAVPGPFGAGKTIVQHQIAKWADVDIVVYIGCGERGNEMTDVMNEFPRLIDPKTGNSLMERTVLIANTSNMPVAAREASIYTGITIAEYYRDMGYDIAIMADSTSRWAEALREMSGRLEEMPGDEGYPAYLGSRISNYYERAGNVVTLGWEGRVGSITAISAVSPQGGDIAEPVTQNTLRIVKVFWGLDAGLARSRHFPAINWMISYSLHADIANEYYDQFVGEDMSELIKSAFVILQEEDRLQEFVRLVGIEAMSDGDRLKLEIAKSIREDFLQQSAFDPVDAFASLRKQRMILKLILDYYAESKTLIDKRLMGFGEYYKKTHDIREKIARAKNIPERELDDINGIMRDMHGAIASIRQAKERDDGGHD